MRLHTKLMWCVTGVLLALMAGGGWWWYRVRADEFKAQVARELDRTQAFLDATRSYAREVLKTPAIKTSDGKTIPDGMFSSRVVRGVFERFARKYPLYHFKEASDNPLNIDNVADPFELELLKELRANPTLLQVDRFYRDGSGNEWYVAARPTYAEQSCLACHGSPAEAPKDIVARYGKDHGYGWQVGDIVAAVTVRVPTHELRSAQRALARDVTLWVGGLTAGTLAAVYLCTIALVGRPVRRIAAKMHQIADKKDYGRRLGEEKRRDEVGVACRAFNYVLGAVGESLTALESANRNLEFRVAERTAAAEASRQEAEAANHAKSSFLANMSHEIRTPMTAILGYADLMMQPDQTLSDRLDAVGSIRRNARHLLELINEILDLSKIEAGKMVVERVLCDMAVLLGDLDSMMRPRALEQALEFEIEFSDGGVPRRLMTDPLRLKQILVNLVGNAVKFTARGRVTVVVGWESEGARGPRTGTLRIAVRDTGIGMSDEQVTRLFQPFTQADDSMTRKYGGTGLGLTISQRLAKLLGGQIDVQSAPDVGSTFVLLLHLDRAGDAEKITSLFRDGILSAGQAEDVEPRINAKILLAEDGIDNQRLLASILRRAGAEVVLAETGKSAVEQARSGAFDLILMDMQMPELDGYEATAQLRARGLTLPIIALTAHAMADDRAKCLKAGCSEYLTKPVDRKVLLDAVRSQLPAEAVTAASASASPTTENENPRTNPADTQDESASPEASAPAVPAASAASAASTPPPPAPAPAAPAPVIPPRPPGPTLRSEFADDPEMQDLIEQYVDGLPEQVARIVELLEDENVDALRREVHKIKGAGGGYGFAELTDLAAKAEKRIRAGDALEKIAAEVQSLVDHIRRVEGYQPALEVQE